MWTLQNAAVLVVLAALGGLTMLIIRLRGTNPPTWLASGHGIIALAGAFILMHLYRASALPQQGTWALGAFVLAAMGGFFLFLTYQIRGRLLPLPIVIGHGLIAAMGVGLLLNSIYGFIR